MDVKASEIGKWINFYYNQGFSIIPLGKNKGFWNNNKDELKRPSIKSWDKYKNTRATKEKIQEWIDNGLFKNIGIIGGHVSNDLVIIDIDDESIPDLLELKFDKILESGAWPSKTGKGYQIWMKHHNDPGGIKRPIKHKIEFRSNNGYCVAPPSTHPNGKNYHFIGVKDFTELSVLKDKDVKSIFNDFKEKIGKKWNITTEKYASQTKTGEAKDYPECISIALKTITKHPMRYYVMYGIASHFAMNHVPQDMTMQKIKQFNMKKCIPPHDNNIVESLVNGAYKPDAHHYGCEFWRDDAGLCPYEEESECQWGKKKARRELLKKYKVYETKKDKKTGKIIKTGKINCIRLAKAIMDMNYHFKRIVDESTGQDDIIYYEDGYYHLGGEDIAKGETDEFLKDDAIGYRRNEVMKAIKYKLSNRLDRDKLEPDPRYINMDNGIYDIKTGELLPHSPDFMFLNKITTKYDPNADCPKIKKFYSEVLYEKDILVKQEEAGLLFYRKHVFERAFVSLGGGANGKGTSEYLFMRAIGRRNYSTRSLTDLTDNTFAKAELYAKMANFGGEISSKYMKDSSVMKRITGGEEITAERKGKTGFSFLPYSILCFNANELPKHKDKTYAFYRRWVVVVYPNTFMESNPNTNSTLRDELTTPEELSGFFNWAMIGLKRIFKDEKLTYNDYVDGEPVYDMLSQPESIFIDDYLTNVPEVFLTTDAVYEKYKIWAENRKYQIQSKSLLTQKILNRFKDNDIKVKAKIKRIKENDKSVSKRCYVNLTWTADADDIRKDQVEEIIPLEKFGKKRQKQRKN